MYHEEYKKQVKVVQRSMSWLETMLWINEEDSLTPEELVRIKEGVAATVKVLQAFHDFYPSHFE